MNDSEFNALADVALKRIETGLERSGADLDFEMVSDSVLEIEFSDRSRIIVNRHDAAQEIWVAARSGGFHYRWDGSDWQDTRHDEELMAALSRLVSEQAGEPVSLARRPVPAAHERRFRTVHLLKARHASGSPRRSSSVRSPAFTTPVAGEPRQLSRLAERERD